MPRSRSPLTTKQKLFADFYVGEARFIATKAALLAGYSEASARTLGSENLKKPAIRAYIDQRLTELTLGASEVLARLTEIANGSIEPFLDEEGNFDYKAAKKAGVLPLLKKLKRRKTSKTIDAPEGGEPAAIETTEEFDFEVYSSHEALRDLGKFHRADDSHP